ncbi:nitrate ABC transporter substrate-binding protein [Promicromonospora soli]|uniref:Nitrate ABC transporter substrate-binding protein n=2 Tax=Promicromonospora soli TaxID=2035533 RepID=A0A919FP47_9MICO|nr:nitrate ABC transporter substrate-binding protein [Promicromonospora soli]
MSLSRPRRLALAALTVVPLVALTGCGGADEQAGGTTQLDVPAAEADGPLDLAGVCPATVVMQQDWQPEAEHGSMYSLVGSDHTVDAEAKSVTGSLVAQGFDTGVDVEVRPGGPNVNFQPVPSLMYLDESILLGAVTSDAQIAGLADNPVVTVASQLTNSPQIVMWDPESHDGAATIEEAAAAGDPIVSSGDVFPQLLASQGIIDDSQIDLSYEGTPQRFVSDPSILQQGFATAEPYIYENEIPQWGKPIGYQLLADVGYSVYPEALAVRADKVEENADCLAKLVPIMQQAQIDYLEDPQATNELIVDLVDQYQTGWTYSLGVADYSVQAQKDLDIVSDDPASGVFGRLDPERMTEIVDTFAPILVDAGQIESADIDPESLYTNEFIDDAISMGS